MDAPIAPRTGWRRRSVLGLLVLGVASVGSGFLWRYLDASDNQVRVRLAELAISTVVAGTFEDFVPVRAQAVPRQTVFVDASEVGRVEQTLVEDGARVTRGEVLARLSNSALQLQVTGREAQLLEQINSIRNEELALERSRLDGESRLTEALFRARVARSELEQQRALERAGFVSEPALRRAEDQSRFEDEKLQVLRESLRKSDALAAHQLAQLKNRLARVEESLAPTRQLLEALVIRASIDGVVTGFTLRPGQSLAAGARIAQIDGLDGFKLAGNVDEFYLPRVAPGQPATAAGDRGELKLQVTKVFPQVTAGQFRIELEYSESTQPEMRRGQAIDVRLNLGAPSQSLLLPNSAFLADSGGTFVFRLDADGRTARKVPVRTGRRNARFVEVSEGLREGERVVTSSYSAFADRRLLALDAN